MDDRRFDSLVKSLATGGTSRRALFKGLLGLGGAAAVGGTVLEGTADAARRPTPTPTPVKCPGNQTPVGGVCTCPAGLSQCNPGTGPACCNDTAVAPGTATYSECCDNACCHGHCYGEELCCPYPRTFCEATQECCPIDLPYCCGDGCCATPCCDTTEGNVCCAGDTPKCCPEDICIPADGCCTDSECPGCQSCENHICVDDRSNCPGGEAGCDECVNTECVANNQRCDDGNPCNDDICTVGTGQCSHPLNCHGQASCCDDGNPCTSNICNENGTCSNPANCNGLNSCCDDGNACTSNICNENGTCSYPFFCTSDSCCDDQNPCTSNICNTTAGTCSYTFNCNLGAGCCPAGQACGDNGQCFTPCVGLGEICTNNPCCDGNCYSLVPELPSVCGPCIPDGVPCLTFCEFCCDGSTLGFCGTIDLCLPKDIPCLSNSDCCSNSCTGAIIPTCD
jgi:hypothetical protein